MATVSYKDAGVDIDAGNQFVENIKPYVKSTIIPGVLGGIGSFAGAFELPSGYKKPVILSGTDGVGTKLKLAIDAKKFDTVGIDLVAMCSNDLLCNFGEPLFFLDYYATAKLDVNEATQVVKGIAEGCIRSECALVGGETAEMPGMYKEGDFDLAGFCVGIAEKDELDRISKVKAGDVLIALPSSGVHSNGFSLVRKLLLEKLGMSLEDDFQGKKLKDVLLEPTRIYVKEFKANKDKINALAHITGGGITENLPRVLPENLTAVVQRSKIKVLPIFEFMSNHVELEEMYRTFNMGVGMVLVVNPANVDAILANTDGYVIGELKSGERKVEFI
ncbi:phosphoribosylformylglycinamidine cyclo-ligase [Aliarcobacter butzleri]|uniref:phosphoribosylformylglycinamidine cyclo-ligase n=1 Tax=Aliarcobacter butzleri TaxID=28197 RepID=UPI00062E84FD|nr:phosphoribosylformylglycinamidine cyclo-ligase [Aliarcobacter butzleri]KLD99121.1 phosphoribosylaminoimidazole synthetase [Aliarcobacter butzleri L349]MCG3669651.1 phosphoribosylformylglycinamidine cyclo-ligase [Aliarcobacter butzleri]MCT7585764.1 phosphoribosylformylglycinamidine cyclo-ligase [Aliarcobacter butzleri]MDN5061102.1 phosphoribosylformylglycinamidine cyclo-ligase [Aliarcobacter butzleri]MDN5100570.1 phosphoribosylformylglycinamidine cyclo-ligase [Aliarcobacter butzleri]